MEISSKLRLMETTSPRFYQYLGSIANCLLSTENRVIDDIDSTWREISYVCISQSYEGQSLMDFTDEKRAWITEFCPETKYQRPFYVKDATVHMDTIAMGAILHRQDFERLNVGNTITINYGYPAGRSEKIFAMQINEFLREMCIKKLN